MMLELLHLSFRKILHQRNHKFGCMRTDPPNLEISISFSAVRELHFEVSICTYLDKRNNMNSTKTFGFMTLFFLPNWWIILSFFFFPLCGLKGSSFSFWPEKCGFLTPSLFGHDLGSRPISPSTAITWHINVFKEWGLDSQTQEKL